MVSLHKTVDMTLRYKDVNSGEWHIVHVSGKKTDVDISRIIAEFWAMMDDQAGSRHLRGDPMMYILQENWARTGENVTLVEYIPHVSLYTNRDHIAKTL